MTGGEIVKAKMEGMIKIRKEQNLTQIELCEKIGTNQGAISGIENRTLNSTQKMLQRIADALGVTIKELY